MLNMERLNKKHEEPVFAKLKTGETVLILARIDHDNRKTYIEPDGVYVCVCYYNTVN